MGKYMDKQTMKRWLGEAIKPISSCAFEASAEWGN